MTTFDLELATVIELDLACHRGLKFALPAVASIAEAPVSADKPSVATNFIVNDEAPLFW